jgi:signal transduction histidine kinase
MTNPSESPPETHPEWNPRHYSRRHFRQRPPWWPENEQWPPNKGPFRRNPFFRRLGCAFAFISLLLCGLFFAAAAFIGNLLAQTDFSQFTTNIPLIIVFSVLVLVGIGAVGYGVRRIFSPLGDLLDAADRVAEGDYSVHVDVRGPREVRSLVRAFNNMASRLHLEDEQRRTLLADVTHELRNPLTVIQGNLEGMLDGVYPSDDAGLRSLLDETVVLSRLMEDLRTLALAESGALKLKKESTDLRVLIRDTASSFQSQMDSTGVTLTIDPGDDLLWVELDPGRIRQVLFNLVTNAMRYTPVGGVVSIHYSHDKEHALIEVRDTGSGIPAEELDHIFDRFYKSADSGGMGLGLSIAKHLVEAHGGTLAATSNPGLGTTMLVSLPTK